MKRKYSIGIVTGGDGDERAVSLASSRNIQNILDISDGLVFDYPKDKSRIIDMKDEIDIIIPMIHGEGGEDGEAQEFLGSIGLEYLFSSPEVHKKALDKREAKKVVKKEGINVPREYEEVNDIDRLVFAKPLNGGSSVKTMMTSDKEVLKAFLSENKDVDFIIEEAILGREFSVGVIDYNHETMSLPVVEIKPKGDFFDYTSKYEEENLAEEVCPADIDGGLRGELQRQAKLVHEIMGCKDISRSDFIVNKEGEIFFLEVNTIPGMPSTSLVPKELNVVGISMRALFENWMENNIILRSGSVK